MAATSTSSSGKVTSGHDPTIAELLAERHFQSSLSMFARSDDQDGERFTSTVNGGALSLKVVDALSGGEQRQVADDEQRECQHDIRDDVAGRSNCAVDKFKDFVRHVSSFLLERGDKYHSYRELLPTSFKKRGSNISTNLVIEEVSLRISSRSSRLIFFPAMWGMSG